MIAYNTTHLFNLKVIREAKRWYKQGVVREDQFLAISNAYASSLYSPSHVICVMLFIASVIALVAITSLLVISIFDSSETAAGVGCIFFGLIAFVCLDRLLIKAQHHYKSGVTEALLYYAMAMIIGGIAVLSGNEYATLIVSVLLFLFASIRYLDVLSAIASFVSFGWLAFISLYELGDFFQQVIPFVFMGLSCALYLVIYRVAKNNDLYFWNNVVLALKVCCLVTVYLAGNYFIVQNLSESMMGVYGEIPFAWIFYAFTVIIPLVYLCIGVRYKNVVLLRISLLMIAFSAFTFKYYFSFGHPEITLTIAGSLVLLTALVLLNYLKVMRNGYTRENIYTEKWSSLNAEAFIVSQTMGGNKLAVQEQEMGGGGSFGGGGASDTF